MSTEVLAERPEEPAHALSVSFRHVGPICLLSLRGDLRAASLRVLESQVDRLGRTSCHQVVVDLAELTSIDDAGVRVLTGLHHYVQARGGHLTVIGAGDWIGQALAETPLTGRG